MGVAFCGDQSVSGRAAGVRGALRCAVLRPLEIMHLQPHTHISCDVMRIFDLTCEQEIKPYGALHMHVHAIALLPQSSLLS